MLIDNFLQAEIARITNMLYFNKSTVDSFRQIANIWET